MRKSYSVNFNSQLKAAKSTLFYILILLLSISLIIYYQEPNDVLITIKIVLLIGMIIIGPSLFLHFSYYLENKDLVITESKDSLEIFNIKTNKKLMLDNDTIKSLDIYMSSTMADWNATSGLPNESYTYAHCKTINGDINITCLLYPNINSLQAKFIKVNPIVHRTIFALFSS